MVPNPIGYFEVPKVIVAEILICSLIFWTIFVRKLITKEYSRIGIAALAVIFGLSFFHLVILKDTELFWGNIFRLQGVFLLWNLLILALVSWQFPFKKSFPSMAYATLGGLALSCFFYGTNHGGRIVGSLGEPNALAATAVFFFALTSGFKKPALTLLAWLLALGMVFVSGSRSGLLALSIVTFFLLATRFGFLSLKKRLIIALVLVFATYFTPFYQPPTWYEYRAEIWLTSFIAGQESLFIGHGFANTSQTLLQTSQQLENNIRYQFVDSAHNIFLEYFIQGGLFALISLLILMFLSIKKLLYVKQIPLLAAWIGLLVSFSFNPMSVVNLIALWWLIGQGLTEND